MALRNDFEGDDQLCERACAFTDELPCSYLTVQELQQDLGIATEVLGLCTCRNRSKRIPMATFLENHY